jgi:hypothetical protein
MGSEIICRRARVRHMIGRELGFFLRLVGSVGFCTHKTMVAPVFQIAPPVLAWPWQFAGGAGTAFI